jgi:hypothetical protein
MNQRESIPFNGIGARRRVDAWKFIKIAHIKKILPLPVAHLMLRKALIFTLRYHMQSLMKRLMHLEESPGHTLGKSKHFPSLCYFLIEGEW